VYGRTGRLWASPGQHRAIRSPGGGVAERIGRARGRAEECRHAFLGLEPPQPSSADAQALLAQAYGPEARTVLRGFLPPELRALTLLLDYARATVGQLPDALLPPRRAPIGGTMEIDAPTLRGLEVFSAVSGRGGALLSVLDRTVTPPGALLLNRQLRAPLTDPETIRRPLAMVRYLVDAPQIRAGCGEGLSGMPDMLRACGRLSLGKAGPRDLAAVRDGLARARVVVKRGDESIDRSFRTALRRRPSPGCAEFCADPVRTVRSMRDMRRTTNK
jgi:DNA mismatch repair protein MutS